MLKQPFKIAGFGAIGLLVLFGLIQLIPYGRAHDNPPVVSGPNWDSPQTLQLAQRACFDCHSNQSTWPWYSNVAPVSWLVQHDVDEGRQVLNFSEWGSNPRAEQEAEWGRTISRGEMPPAVYLITHVDARLTDTEKQQLIDGLNATAGVSGEGNENGPDGDDD